MAKREVQAAAEQFRQALALAQRWGLLPASLHLLVGFGALFRHHGDIERAVSLLALAANHSASLFETSLEAKRGLELFPTDVVEAGVMRAKDLTPEEIAEELLAGSSTAG